MKIITISREYGAGGHTIAKQVAQRLGVEIYDKDILRGTAASSGIDISSIAAEEEFLTTSHSIVRMISPRGYDEQDSIHNWQQSVIMDLAKKGPCVILGRCANVVLDENGVDCLNVFVYADVAHRVKRVGELIGSDNINEIQRTIAKYDKGRHAYYNYYTGHHWGDYRDFDLMLDSGQLGYEKCVDMICRAVEE